MREIRIAVVSVAVLVLAGSAAAESPAVAGAMSHLRTQHPRLLVLDDQMTAVRSAVGADRVAEAIHDRLHSEAERLLAEPVNTYVIGGPEHTLLSVARSVEGRVFLLSGLYRVDHDRRFADRAAAEMREAAAFADWYPKHFLDTAETTAALAVGYDWCFDALAPDDRVTIRRAIVDKGLDPGLKLMRTGQGFSRAHSNWVQVCYGGLTLGALAVADDEPARAAEVVDRSITPMTAIMKLFAPDGGFEEGPVYWNYATTFNTYYLAALDTAVGTDLGLSAATGFADTGAYRMQSIDPLHLYANFGDCGTSVDAAAQMFWMARRFHRPLYARQEADLEASLLAGKKSPPILGLLWRYPAVDGAVASEPTARAFDRVSAAFMRSSWGDPMAGYLAFKGGDGRASHGHADLGQFVCDLGGQRWAVDLGAESYGLPGYFGKQRFTYFRTSTAGHNTLTVDGHNQSPAAHAPLRLLDEGPGHPSAVVDLGTCYPDQLKRWSRGATLRGADEVLIQDEYAPAKPVAVVWHFHTTATVAVDGRTAVLTRGGATATLRIACPAGAAFTVVDAATPPPPSGANPGLLDVQIALPSSADEQRIAVTLTRGKPAGEDTAVVPLGEWGARG